MDKVKNILIVLLCIGFLVNFFIIKQKEKELGKIQAENVKLNEKIKSLIKIDVNRIQIIYKDRDIVKYLNIYVPPEGGATITTDDNDQIKIDYKKFGFGVYPFLGLGFSNSLKPLVGARLFYFSRYGVGVLTTLDGVSLFADVRTDIGWLKNSSFGIFGNKDTLGVGMHTFF
jgi:hypothetical protein